jgi:hypothetical protein
MIRTLRLLAAAVVLLATVPAHAVKIGGLTVVVPVAIHGPGAQSTQWQTDLWISNPYTIEQDITVTYCPNSAAPAAFSVHIGKLSTIEVRDVVLTRFGLDNSKGMLVLHSEGASQFSAQARIFNTGNPIGEFGQFVPGISTAYLDWQGFIPGLSGVDGNRTNVGIANPWDHEISCQVFVRDGDGTYIGGARTVTVPPMTVLQVNDIFTAWGIPPQDNLQLDINGTSSGDRFYAYASVVRDGSGDAIFIFGTSPNA